MAKRTVNLGIAFSLAALLFPNCREKEPAQEIIRPVRYLEAAFTKGIYVRSFSGVAQSGTESRLSFRVPGTIKAIPVRVGDDVRTGQLIAELDSYDYELKLQQAEAALLQAKARSRNADVNYERARTLYEQKSASKSELDSARMASEAANADVQVLEKQVELARTQLSYTRIRAPLEGAIADVRSDINENIQAGMPIVLLTSGTHIEVKISIPETLIAQIEEGKNAAVKFDAIPGKEFQAEVTEVGVRSMGTATTFPVTLLLAQVDPDIRAGMTATAAFQFMSDTDRERFIVPSEAVGEDRQGRFVFLVTPLPEQEDLGVIRRQPVTIGEMTSGGMEILTGLTAGDLVVTAGINYIDDGQKVKL
jgi:RND family efflux transporter MFP subunit